MLFAPSAVMHSGAGTSGRHPSPSSSALASRPARLAHVGPGSQAQPAEIPQLCPGAGGSIRAARRRRALQLRALEGGRDARRQEALASLPEPEDAKGAIAVGLEQFNADDYQGALDTFTKALSLPGTGIKQFRDKPPAISRGEKQAALYNLACCHARLGSGRDGLQHLIYLLEAGYDDFEQLRLDPDLAALRKEDQYEMVIQRFKPQQKGFFGSLLKGFQG